MSIPKGQSYIEILVAIGVFMLFSVASVLLFFGGQSLAVDSVNAQFALDYASEGIEAVRSIQNRDWDELADGDHGLVYSGGQWQFSSTNDSDDKFTRKVTVTTLSDDTKKIVAEITWQTDPARPQVITLVMELTNWEAAQEENENVGGDTGGGGTSGDWLNPQTLGTADVGPGGQATDLDVLNKFVYLTSKASDKKKDDFFIIDATDGNNPTVIAFIDTGPGLNVIDVTTDYAYVGNDDKNSQLQILAITGPVVPDLKSTYQLPGVSGNDAIGNSIFFYDNKVYMGTKEASGPEFHIIDVTDPVSPVSLGSKEINADVNAIQVKGDYAYLATSDDTKELQIWDISDPANITSAGNFDAVGGGDGKSAYLLGTKLYLGRISDGNNELNILDVANPAVIQSLGSQLIGADVNDLRVRDNLAFVGTSDANREFQAWDISDPANITLWSSFNFSQVATGIDYEDNVVYVSVRSNDALRIITSTP